MRTRSLEGEWQLTRAGGESVYDGSVPGDVYSDLLAAGAIEDPHVDDNERDVQWVGKSDWTYERTVNAPASLVEQQQVTLVCEGIDTVATVTVNGTEVGTTDNAHRRYEFDVTDPLEAGDNEITVAVRSPVEYGIERDDAHPHDVPWMDYPIEQPARNFVRKPQYHYGWDWGPCLPSMGIWRSIRLVGHSGPRIQEVSTSQDHSGDGVTLDVTVLADAPESETRDLDILVSGASLAHSVTLDAGENRIERSLTVEGPDLWWPHDMGDQPLSKLRVSLGGETHTEQIGFRSIEIVREPDDKGESFAIAVNGVETFAKGANWIPTHVLPGQQDPERREHLLESAREANMNIVRVWGGGQYEREAFYEQCDRLGLLVWQDFMFACSAYPADDEFLDTVEVEARQQVRRLSTHPSVAVWCGNNEVEMGLNTWFAEEDNLEQLTEDYRVLFHDRLPTVLEEEHPDSPYWPSSPSSGMEAAFDADGLPSLEGLSFDTGTMHDWRVWHDGEPFEAYEDVVARFDAEFGYQSFASVETLSTVLEDDQLNPTAPLMEHHQRSEGGNGRIVQRMVDTFRLPLDFERFVFVSQLQQLLAMKVGIEHWRRQRPECMGTIFWQLNDVWPCASWSSIEFGGRWKALQYAARRFYAPVLISTRETDDGLELWVTNDEQTPVSEPLSITATTLAGDPVYEDELEASVDGPGSAAVETVPIAELTGEYDRSEILVRVDCDCDAETYPNFAVLDRYKRMDLPDPGLEIIVNGQSVTVDVERAALFVTLQTTVEGQFSDNCFHLAPGEQRTVEFDGHASGRDLLEELTVVHLQETY